jgi:hypothetical protein
MPNFGFSSVKGSAKSLKERGGHGRLVMFNVTDSGQDFQFFSPSSSRMAKGNTAVALRISAPLSVTFSISFHLAPLAIFERLEAYFRLRELIRLFTFLPSHRRTQGWLDLLAGKVTSLLSPCDCL